MGRIRIIGGECRRRWLDFPDVAGLRPTPDRVRETVFNWLGQTLYGKRCLDLFSGSGALGFEAASRGAESVDLVENNRTAFKALQDNQKKLACVNMALHCMDGLEFARLARGKYDVIFLDPPFGSDLLLKVLPLLADKLQEGGLVYVESGDAFEPGAGWQVVKSARAGNVQYQLLTQGHEAPT